MIEVIPDPDEEREQMLSRVREIRDYFYTHKRRCSECSFLKECIMCFKGCPGDWEI